MMAILIAKLIKRVFYDNETGCCWIKGKAGKGDVLIEFSEALHDLPKILKTVEYKLIGEWRKMRNGNKKFEVSKYEKIGRVNFTKKPVRPII